MINNDSCHPFVVGCRPKTDLKNIHNSVVIAVVASVVLVRTGVLDLGQRRTYLFQGAFTI
jgi:hypothetical protein